MDIVDALTDRSQPHNWTLKGHETRKGVLDRWGWVCVCGARSRTRRMTLRLAKLDWEHHAEKGGAS